MKSLAAVCPGRGRRRRRIRWERIRLTKGRRESEFGGWERASPRRGGSDPGTWPPHHWGDPSAFYVAAAAAARVPSQLPAGLPSSPHRGCVTGGPRLLRPSDAHGVREALRAGHLASESSSWRVRGVGRPSLGAGGRARRSLGHGLGEVSAEPCRGSGGGLRTRGCSVVGVGQARQRD